MERTPSERHRFREPGRLAQGTGRTSQMLRILQFNNRWSEVVSSLSLATLVSIVVWLAWRANM